MLKTFCHIAVSLLLLVATTGVAVSKHFCDEFLISTSLFTETESCCDNGACCHHETEFIQVQEDYQPSLTRELPPSVEIELLSSEIRQLNLEDWFCINQPAFAEFNPPLPPKIQTVLSLKQAYLL